MKKKERDLAIKMAIEFMHYDGFNLNVFSETLRDDKEFIKPLVEIEPLLLKYAGSEIKDNEDFVKLLLPVDGTALKYASLRLQSKITLVLEALQDLTLKEIIEPLRDNKTVVMEAMKHYGAYEFQYASKRLREDPEVVYQALINHQRKALIEHVMEWTSPKIQEEIKNEGLETWLQRQ